jgi:hypothetical protein
MQYQKGLFRVWVVGTVIWVPFSLLLSVNHVLQQNLVEYSTFADLIPFNASNYIFFLIFAIFPPLLCLALYRVLRWVIDGFRK